MKRILATTVVLALFAGPLAAQGHMATAGNEVTIDGEEYLIMTEEDILAVVD